MNKGDLAAAEPLCREALKVQRETLGNRHPNTLTSINNLGGLLLAKGASPPPSRCFARRLRDCALLWAVGIRTRSPPSAISAGC